MLENALMGGIFGSLIGGLIGALIGLTIIVCQLIQLKGKNFEQLTPAQEKRVEKAFNKHIVKKRQQNTDTRIEDYVPIYIQKMRRELLIGIVLLPVFLAALVLLYVVV